MKQVPKRIRQQRLKLAANEKRRAIKRLTAIENKQRLCCMIHPTFNKMCPECSGKVRDLREKVQSNFHLEAHQFAGESFGS